METTAAVQGSDRPRIALPLSQAFFIGVISLSACRLDGVTKPSLEPELKIDPSVAARLEAAHFTGAVISYVSLSNGYVRSRPSQAARSSSRPTQNLRTASTVSIPTSAPKTMDLTSDLMFIV